MVTYILYEESMSWLDSFSNQLFTSYLYGCVLPDDLAFRLDSTSNDTNSATWSLSVTM